VKQVVVVGGVAGGMSAAARLRRLDETAHIVVLEKGNDVSFANCGLPYHVGGEIAERSALLLHTPETLRASLDLDVRTRHEVVSIDREARTVAVRDLDRGADLVLPYDALVLATGADPIVPPLPGLDRPQVRTLRNVPDADVLRDMLAAGAQRAVVIGAGFIGLETVEAFRHRGLDVALVELAPQVLPALDADMAHLVEQELRAHDVDVRTGVAFTAVEDSTTPGHPVDVVLADGTRLPADVVLLGVGVKPSTKLAREAGLDLSDRGAVVVSASQQTSDPAIWAVGDAIQVVDAVTGVPGVVPLAGPANRQGRIAADAIMGRASAAKPVLGTAVVKVFGLTAAVTGPTSRRLTAAGVEHHVVHLHPGSHAGYYPGAQTVHLAVLFAPDGRLLGAQAVGSDGVDKRIDVLATALRAGMDVDDLAELELAYAPPFGSAKDPVNMAAFIAQNVLDGTTRLWRAEDLDTFGDDVLLLDVRSRREYAGGHLPGAINVPHTELRDHLEQVAAAAAGRPVKVLCASGFRSYLAHRVLSSAGLDSASLDGGMKTLLATRPGQPLVVGSGDAGGTRALVMAS